MNQTQNTSASSMFEAFIKTFLVFLASTLFIALPSVQAEQELASNDLVNALRKGGYSIYFRHEATEWSQQDRVYKEDDWLSCDPRKIRQLSDAGRQRAKQTGQIIQKLGIPINEVIASPYCRTMETARMMNLGQVKPSNDVINMRVAEYFGGRQAIIKSTRALLSTPPTNGFNRVIVAHGNVAQSATPVYPDEGEGVAFKVDGHGGFEYVGRLTADQWSRLAQQKLTN